MRMPSLTSLSPKSVCTRFGNRRRTSSTSSTATTTSTASRASAGADKSALDTRPTSSAGSLYGLFEGRRGSGGGGAGGDWGCDQEYLFWGQEMSVLEPRPRYCVGLFEVLEL